MHKNPRIKLISSTPIKISFYVSDIQVHLYELDQFFCIFLFILKTVKTATHE